jgi:hypothetical protein
MIPDGWVLVPLVPTERMLTEFSGVWAPWLPKARRDLELKAYADMLAAVPTPPSECGAMQDRLFEQARTIRGLTARNEKAWEKIHKLRHKVSLLEAQLEERHNERANPIH